MLKFQKRLYVMLSSQVIETPLRPSTERLWQAGRWILALAASGVFVVHDEDGRRWSLSHLSADGKGFAYIKRHGVSEPRRPRALKFARAAPRDGPAQLSAATASQRGVRIAPRFADGDAAAATTYSKLRCIGQGSFGHVFKVVDPQGRFFALKQASESSGQQDASLRREAGFMHRLAHACVVELHDMVEQAGSTALVMPLATCTLAQRQRSFCSEGFLLGCLGSLHTALRHMHDVGLVHLDVKPANVLLFGPQAKLADFGSVQGNGDRLEESIYVFTRPYRPPEVLLGSEMAFFAMDAWAFGAIALELAMQRDLPYGKCSVEQTQLTLAMLGPPSFEELEAALAPWTGVAAEDAPSLSRASQLHGSPAPAVSFFDELRAQSRSEDIFACSDGLLCYDALARLAAFDALKVPGGQAMGARSRPDKRKRHAGASSALGACCE